MLIQDTAPIADLLACPSCRGHLAASPDGPLSCRTPGCGRGGTSFDRIGDKDILVDFGQSVLDREAILASGGASTLGRDRWRKLLQRVVDGKNHYSPHYARTMVRELEQSGKERPTILVVGGGGIGSGAEELYASDKVGIVSFDIYVSPHVSFVADGHAIPLKDASVDAIWVQAVLEHTADPHRIVAEMRRVLRPGGLIFANVAFLWPVCEQAYDYSRYTASGLRWLFRDYEVIAMGHSSGPGTTAALAIRYLFQSLTRSNKWGQLLAFPFVWLRLLDRWCGGRRAFDAASALFFYGRLAEQPLPLERLVPFYEEQARLEATARSLRE